MEGEVGGGGVLDYIIDLRPRVDTRNKTETLNKISISWGWALFNAANDKAPVDYLLGESVGDMFLCHPSLHNGYI